MDELRWMIARQIPHLRRFALALTRDEDRADDLVQDCLERALRKRHLWHRRGSLRSWMFRLLYRIHADHKRSRWRERATETVEAMGETALPPEQERRVDCRNIAEALDRLPADQRSAILLVALEGLPYDQAAAILGIPIGTLRSRLSRGRESLRQTYTASAGQTVLRRVK